MREDWKIVLISEVAEVSLGKTPQKSQYRDKGKNKIIKFRDVSFSGIIWDTDKQGYVCEDSLKDLKKLQINDILITSSAHSSESIGKKISYVRNIPDRFENVFYVGELLNIRSIKYLVSYKLVYFFFYHKLLISSSKS